MKKKLLSLLLSLSLTASLLLLPSTQVTATESSVSVRDTAAHIPTDESFFTYTVKDGEATVTGVDAAISGAVVIPDTLGGYPVTKIGYRAFGFHGGITSLVIPEGVTSIASYAVQNCPHLESITIPASATSIADYAVYICTGLASITVDPENTKYHSAGDCLIETASGTLVLGCKNSVIPADGSVTSIGNNAFRSCTGLSSITIPASVTGIGDYAFHSCRGLAFVSFAKDSRLTSIGNSAFYNCLRLTAITIPAGVTSIGRSAFYGCYKLVEVCDASALSLQAGSDAYGSVAKHAKNVYTPQNGESKLLSQGDYLFFADNNVYDLLGYTGSDTDITLPASVNGSGYRIYPYAFAYYQDLRSVTVPDGVTSIGESAFDYCGALTSIRLPDGIKSIDDFLFYYCTSLSSVEIPASVTSIGEGSFYYCTSLTSVEIPASVTSVSPRAFSGCSNLVSLTVADGNNAYHAIGNCLIETVGGTLVSGCKNSVIPADGSVTSLGAYAFYGTDLTKITIPESVSSIGDTAFFACDALALVTVLNPSVAKRITSSTSQGYLCYNAKTVAFSAEITEIGSYITDNFTNVHTVVTDGRLFTVYSKHSHAEDSDLWVGGTCTECGFTQTNVVDESLFHYTVSNGKATITAVDTAVFGDIILPETLGGYPVTSIGAEAFAYCSGLTSVIIGDGVTDIGDCAFVGCTSLASITIPDSVTSIGDYAFVGCTSLASITIPGSVTSIGDYAFTDCTDLASITIPGSVTSIGDYAFSDCTDLASITIPDSVTSIGNYAFYNAAYYSNISNWKNGVLYIDNHLIKAKTTLSGKYTVKPGTVCIADSAFYNCASLTSVTIPDSVTSIGASAFYGCSNLASITIPFVGAEKDGTRNTHFGYIFGASSDSKNGTYVPASLKTAVITGGTKISSYAFRGCTSLASITVPDSVTSIDRYAFWGCTSLTSFTIPDHVTSIGQYAFHCCTSLAFVTIPGSVTSIGNYAFYSCTSLASITIPESVTSIGNYNYTFYACTSLASVTILSPTVAANIESSTSSGYLCNYAKTVVVPKTFDTVGSYIKQNLTFADEIYIDGVPYTVHAKHSHAKDASVWAEDTCTECGLARDTVVEEPMLGDINADGVVDIADIVAVINAASGTPLDPVAMPGEPDVTNDTVVDIADIVAVINVASGE